MKLITPEEAQTLMDVRRILKNIASRAQTEGINWVIDRESKDYPDGDAYDFGMVNQIARTAEWEVFQVLNIIKNHLGDEVAEEIIG